MKKNLVILFVLLLITPLLATEEALVVIYEKELEGILTTSGEYFSHKELTAGHESLPIGSIVEFVNPTNKNRVELTINDRILTSDGMFWISGTAADALGIKSIYPTKTLINILYKPEVKEVYEDEMQIPVEPIYTHSQIETVGYEPEVYTPVETLPTPNVYVQESTPRIVTSTPVITQSTPHSPILQGLSENLETAIGDPRIPKSAYRNIQGYGVHIYTTVNSSEAIEASQRLYNHFACPSYIEKYHSPLGDCFRVIAGDYRSESEALQWYNKLSASIPGIFLVEIY